MPMMLQNGVHHIPVVNDEHRLVGITTQSDLVAALYHGRLDNDAA